jgi:bifunctional non-homologous end joining protein LigD
VRAGFVPSTRREVFDKIKHLKTTKCPFVNLPETADGRWGQGLTVEKMKECVWLKPEVVAHIEFLEWTGADHLRHTKFIALRDDKDPREVVRELSRSNLPKADFSGALKLGIAMLLDRTVSSLLHR